VMNEHSYPKLSFRLNPVIFVVGLMAMAVPTCVGQAGAVTLPASASAESAEYVPTMVFDVASVRENKDISYMMGGYFMPHTTSFRAPSLSIEHLIWTAYGVLPYQVVGAPNWPQPTLFMIEAKGNSDADAKLAALTKEQQKAEHEHMLQVLLAERFKLKAHWETREGDVYNLVIAKGGPKLGAQGSMPLSADEKKMYGEKPAQPLVPRFDERGSAYVAHSCPMDQLVLALTLLLGQPVMDKTGLAGKYDFVLKYKGRTDRDRPADDPDPTLPLDQALQQELGLKVEASKGPLKLLVIDHVEKPTEN
jgi:uncharacterized protein (TIGR03435 family)